MRAFLRPERIPQSLYRSIVVVVMGGTFFSVGAVPLELSTQKADVTLTLSGTSTPILEAGGDFDGDGFNDLSLLDFNELKLLRGGAFPALASLNAEVDMRVSPMGAGWRKFGDFDGDGKEDLFYFEWGDIDQGIRLFYGRSSLPALIDAGNPDLSLVGKVDSYFGRSFVTGGKGGNQPVDLLIGAPLADPLDRTDAGEAYFLPGRSGRRLGTLDVAASSETIVFQGMPVVAFESGLGTGVDIADIDGDDRGELLLSSVDAQPYGRIRAGRVQVIKGQASFLSPWDLANQDPFLSIHGIHYQKLEVLGSGDMNGDGKDELLLRPLRGTGLFLDLLNGSDAEAGASVIDLDATSPTHRAPVPIGPSVYTFGFGDFDGDGRQDLFGNDPSRVWAFLSSEIPEGPISDLTTPSLNVFVSQGSVAHFSLGDLNGDGYQDLAIVAVPTVVGAFKGAIHIVYGFRPLLHPSLHVRERTAGSTAVTLDLSVDGDPTEVKVSGDVAEVWLDRWVAFRRELPVRLSSGSGDKKVRVTFRNRFQRESATVEDTVVLSPVANETQSQTLTNVLRVEDGGRGRVAVECSLSDPGRITASVYDRRGRRLKELMDEDRGIGVWTVEWDGTNSAGRRVAAGIYFLVVESNGRVEKHKIVIRG
jgi:hypothetical protein